MKNQLDRYRRYRAALAGEHLPLALIDLAAMDANIEAVVAPIRGSGKTLRIATKSIRSAPVLRYILERGGPSLRGLMAYSPAEACYLAKDGFDDILIAYPTAQASDARMIADACARGKRISIAVEEEDHLCLLDEAAAAAGTTIPVIVDVDVSLRKAFGRAHIGVRRSPLHDARGVTDFVTSIARFRRLRFAGLLGYEAHIAGVSDTTSLGSFGDGAKRALKQLFRSEVLRLRHDIVRELLLRGIAVPIFNGGGTGSIGFSVSDPSLTEVTAGSGFFASHLFDHYDGLRLIPAAFFALSVTRKPAPGLVTCQGGGFIASGPAGADRLPTPYLPEGLSLLGIEGAGEVQTPLRVPKGYTLSLGDPVFFRHAKAGELATYFNEFLLVRGSQVESRALTYRGAGECLH